MDDEKVQERVALVRTQTQVSGIGQDTKKQVKDGINFNLVSCVWILLREQAHLWRWFIILLIATLVGGELTTVLPTLFPC